MGSTTFTRFVIGILIVGLLIAAWIVIEGIGQAFGQGIAEWMVR